MKKLAVLFLASFILIGCSSNQNSKNVKLPENWRVATQEDAINDWARFNSPNKIVNDFNGDGKYDVAQILLSNNSSQGFNFVVEVSDTDQRKQFILQQSDTLSAQNFSIKLLEPSEEIWESACEKGYWDCAADEIRQFKITKPSIQFCYIESACTVYLWSDRNKNFTKIPLSD
ncbi:hypothetical protein [Acinetobacter sp. CFCC 10889]|uniref:hypothetical protein n=1 Tax=Acinetobacter sp. CFCC 10889 TaxID=1775557 RepID=UPI000DD00C58|nr:hypothetical protein [Acinetobacter sp. CFCC 10889]